jgi:hypothetical protein
MKLKYVISLLSALILPVFGQEPTLANSEDISNLQGQINGKLANSMATGKLLGRGTAGAGSIEEITLGTNLSLTGTTLNAAGGSATTIGLLDRFGHYPDGTKVEFTGTMPEVGPNAWRMNLAGRSISVSTISVNAADSSFNDSGNGFLTAKFAVGDGIATSGFSNAANNGAFRIRSVTAGKIIVEQRVTGANVTTLVNESAGASRTIAGGGYPYVERGALRAPNDTLLYLGTPVATSDGKFSVFFEMELRDSVYPSGFGSPGLTIAIKSSNLVLEQGGLNLGTMIHLSLAETGIMANGVYGLAGSVIAEGESGDFIPWAPGGGALARNTRHIFNVTVEGDEMRVTGAGRTVVYKDPVFANYVGDPDTHFYIEYSGDRQSSTTYKTYWCLHRIWANAPALDSSPEWGSPPSVQPLANLITGPSGKHRMPGTLLALNGQEGWDQWPVDNYNDYGLAANGKTFAQSVSARNRYRMTGLPNDGGEVTIANYIYRWKTTLTGVAPPANTFEVKIGATIDECYTNLSNAISNVTALKGTTWSYAGQTTYVNPQAISERYQLTALPSNNATALVANGIAYTWKTALTGTGAYEVKIGANVNECFSNLRDAVSGNAANKGVTWSFVGSATVANQVMDTARFSSAYLQVRTYIPGAIGNSMVTTTTATNASWDNGATATGGIWGRDVFRIYQTDARGPQTMSNGGFATVKSSSLSASHAAISGATYYHTVLENNGDTEEVVIWGRFPNGATKQVGISVLAGQRFTTDAITDTGAWRLTINRVKRTNESHVLHFTFESSNYRKVDSYVGNWDTISFVAGNVTAVSPAAGDVLVDGMRSTSY